MAGPVFSWLSTNPMEQYNWAGPVVYFKLVWPDHFSARCDAPGLWKNYTTIRLGRCSVGKRNFGLILGNYAINIKICISLSKALSKLINTQDYDEICFHTVID